MSDVLRILLLEDNPSDARLIETELRRAGFEFAVDRVQTEQDFLARLESLPELILAEYNLPQFDALRALRLLRERGVNVPFIIVSATVGEELAVAAMKEGASDYIIKDRLSRLGSAVKVALEQKKAMEARRCAEAALTRCEARKNAKLNSALDAIVSMDGDGKIVEFNPSAERIFGYRRADVIGKELAGLIVPPEYRERHRAGLARYLKTGVAPILDKRVELKALRADGSIFPVELTITRVKLDGPPLFLGFIRDLSEQRKAEQDLAESDRRFRQIAENIHEVFFLVDVEMTRIFYVSPAYAEIWGRSCESLYADAGSFGDTIHPEDRERVFGAFASQGKRIHSDVEYRIVRPDGAIRWIRARRFPIRDSIGDIYRYAGIAEDITGDRLTAGALRESERRFSDMLGNVQLISLMLDRQARITYCNDYLLRLTGWRREEVIGRNWFELFMPQDLEDVKQTFKALLENAPEAWHHENNILTHSGQRRLIQWNNSVLRSASGEVIGTASIGENITERKGAQNAIAEKELRYRRLFEAAKDGILILDAGDGQITDCNPFLLSLLGYSLDEILGKELWEIGVFEKIVASKAAFVELQEKDYVRFDNMPLETKDGRRIEVEFVSNSYKVNGKRVMQCNVRDISERRKLEAQLRQSQKMEAIGHLAGGIAHDFNNLLTIINGRSQLMINRLKPGDRMRDELDVIYQTGERAASLTRQLLAFSRRQVLDPKVLDLNAIAAEMEKMLRCLIKADINLTTVFHPALKRVMADPGQIEQVILNLVVNARDAMPRGGKMIIETANVELSEEYCRPHADVKPGLYVMLAVSDTGCGMDETVKARLFEPFYTTKEKGKSTGLGLSTVFGIVKQSNGHIEVYSELGRGTTFKVYLPQLHALHPATESSNTKQLSVPKGGREVILLVEDEKGVRELVRDVLETNGYTVLQAGHGAEALALSANHKGPIQLLLSDVVMPGISGRELFDQIKLLRPDIKVLFTSGYTDHAIVRNGQLEAGLEFIQKPFTPTSLAHKVRGALDKIAV